MLLIKNISGFHGTNWAWGFLVLSLKILAPLESESAITEMNC